MSSDAFVALLARFTAAIESADADGFASVFTEDAVYTDVFYGRHEGRDAIRRMIAERWLVEGRDFRWEMLEPVSDGANGYANWVFSYTATRNGRRALMIGASRFRLCEGRFADYREWCYESAVLAGMGVPADVIHRRGLARDAQDRTRVDRARHLLDRNQPT